MDPESRNLTVELFATKYSVHAREIRIRRCGADTQIRLRPQLYLNTIFRYVTTCRGRCTGRLSMALRSAQCSARQRARVCVIQSLQLPFRQAIAFTQPILSMYHVVYYRYYWGKKSSIGHVKKCSPPQGKGHNFLKLTEAYRPLS